MQMNNLDKRRIYHGYYLDDYPIKEGKDPCELCELNKHCDEIADTLNQIEYCICLSLNKKYKKEHAKAFFKQI